MNNPNRFLDPFAPISRHQHRLPHFQQGEIYYFVTWRLADSIAQVQLAAWRAERAAWIRSHSAPWNDKVTAEYHWRFSRKIDDWLDQGAGSCLLREPRYARIVADALRYFDGQRYEMHSFVVMPNHVHVLFRLVPGQKLEAVVKSWKRHSSAAINRLAGRSGAFWHGDYWDRMIRNSEHLLRVVRYIRRNPERARLRAGEFILFEKKE